MFPAVTNLFLRTSREIRSMTPRPHTFIVHLYVSRLASLFFDKKTR